MNPVRLSKFLSLVLRHRARDFGLAPDAEGFVPLAGVLAVVRARHPEVDRAAILAVVEASEPRRFEVRGEHIRATYGHSRKLGRPVAYPPVEPPEILYHGTHPAALAGIRLRGLQAMRRHYVHLSTSVERARDVAARRTGSPVILAVRARAAHAAGVVFHSPEHHHYLAQGVPAEFIDFEEPLDA